MKFYVETKNSLSDHYKGTIDPATGWPTIHPHLVTETETKEEAEIFFNKKFTNNVLIVLEV